MQTKERRKKITKEITHSIAVKALTDIPLDCITPATMHVILGLTKKIVDWILTLFTKLESLKEAKTKGVTTYHFRQRTAEAIEKVVEYEEFLLCEFVGLVQSVEGKKKEVQTLMERISQIEEMLAGQPPETHQEFWRVKLEELKEMSIQNQASDEEVNASKQFVELLFLTSKTKAHLEEVKKKHTGDSERELTKALKANQVDQNAFHNGMIVGNMCMKFGENGNAIINDLSKAMSNKIKDPENLTYLEDTKVALKKIIGLWYKLMKVMKSKRRQTDEEIDGFQ